MTQHIITTDVGKDNSSVTKLVGTDSLWELDSATIGGTVVFGSTVSSLRFEADVYYMLLQFPDL